MFLARFFRHQEVPLDILQNWIDDELTRCNMKGRVAVVIEGFTILSVSLIVPQALAPYSMTIDTYDIVCQAEQSEKRVYDFIAKALR